MRTFKLNRWVWIVMGIALAIRVAIFAMLTPAGRLQLPDSLEYERLGINLAHHGEYSLDESPPRKPDMTRTPVYPLYVAACFRVGADSIGIAVAMQVFCAAINCSIVYMLARRFAGQRSALVAGLLLAIDPLSIRYANYLVSETLFTLLFTIAAGCLLAYFRSPNLKYSCMAGVAMGIATMCRPIAILWPPALLPWFAIWAWKDRSWRPIQNFAFFLLLSGLLPGLWIVRNHQIGGPAVITTVQGINLYYHRAAAVLAAQDGISVAEARAHLDARLREKVEQDHLDYAQEYDLMTRWANEIIGASPGLYLRAHTRGIAAMFLPNESTDGTDTVRAIAYWLEASFLSIFYGLAVVGFCRGCRGPNRATVLLLLAVVAYFAVMSGPEAYARFRVPVMPFLALLAGLAFERPRKGVPVG